MTQQTLEQAPEEVKLAVDLICLLEQNDIDPQIAIEALKIVKSDCEAKLKKA